MSHSRIFKLNPNLESEYKRISEYNFEDNGFLDGYHDYVDSDTNEFDDYQWLTTSLGELFKNFRKEGDHYFVDVNKEDAKAYLLSKITSAEANLAKIKVELLYPTTNHSLWLNWHNLLEDTCGDQGGFYFYMYDTYYTDVEFVKELCQYAFKDNDTITFRLEGTLDYHS